MLIGCLSLIATVLIYLGAKAVYSRHPKVYASPLLVTPVILVGLLLFINVPFEAYNAGGRLLTDMLQPATVAFAIPLYKYFPVLKKYAVEIIINVTVGCCIAILSTAFIAKLFKLNEDLIESLVPRSVTTPIAMSVSEMIGGMPAVTAVFVILTALSGSVIGPMVIRYFRIDNEIARGVLLGTSAHGAGTSKAFELSSVSGTISSVSMILAAIITLCAAPFLLSLIAVS
ncbi:CidB/LrgB family autolysis modulator [Bacillus paralicheniformis]|uniref:CidB/LrgB family autolysis modulator n=1 Tax=Bacillus paralicheniformis TaxID=1648923 RepID=UPI002DBE4845|nr:CidB/LrgB family autolysis modulator [Bacillus paralicheniformis]MEC1021169.1 CidB/LrgB family autolysis modulator [Bacillus paralicheniformis]MEC1027079.1 CidB/LrgB family autolysis modulator [Bacillus paralicheniformis]MEC1033240.1 CidB/LrgB family autolysis modulator [Bacillus paralicheniformis]MEC1050966.1 CidB/LrgB family autolysis modulator [Bacillus paralicheniformis]MEC1060568.1 CidB/LrgB family autolysis modulator [Bacillus paralicheniformis]